MVRTNKFCMLFIAALGFIAVYMTTIGILLWRVLSPEEEIQFISLVSQHAELIFFLLIFILVGPLFFLAWIFKLYILPIDNMTEETSIIHSTNPSHRLDIKGGSEINRLVNVINQGADLYEAQQKKVQAIIKTAMAEAEAEIRILAAVMAELTAGIIACNSQGQILLYNNRAKYLLTGSHAEDEENSSESHESTKQGSSINGKGKFMGLGRSIFRIIDKELIDHALEEISEKMNQKDTDVAAYFVIALDNNKLVNVEAIPIIDNSHKFTGFAIIMREIT